MKKNCFSFFLCLLGIALLPSCQSIKEPKLIGIEKVRIQRFGFRESTVSFNLIFFNPNKSRLKLKEAHGDAWLDGNLLGHFTVDTMVHIPPNGDFKMPVQLKMDMSHFLENISAAFMDKQVMLKVDGEAKAGKGFIFIRRPVHYEGKQKLNELLK